MCLTALLLVFVIPTITSYSPCPPRCQCYEDPQNPSQVVHIICKWDELNVTDFRTLSRPETIRTLTIRCSHRSRKWSTPPAGLFVNLWNLDRLEIDRCLLTSLPVALLSGLHKLYSLIIKNAKLPSIPDELLRYTPNLILLDLRGNELRIEPNSVRSLRNLTHLDLSNNSIEFLTNTLLSLTSLMVLAINNNKLTSIDFRRLPEHLTDLSVRSNYINTLHYVPGSARNLHRLDLSKNRLDYIVGSGSVNVLPPSLKQADLSYNMITFIQEGALGHMKDLALLDLKGNLLTELKESSLSGPQNQLRLYLEGNPFQCHCGLRWLIHVREKTAPVVLDLPTLTCTALLDESQVLNLTVADRMNQLMCRYETLCPLSCNCCGGQSCPCRSTCPPQCQCYRSVYIELRNSQNVLVCDNLRLDHFDSIPESATELRLDSATWKVWDIEKFKKLPYLTTLRISNTSITDEELSSLASINSLTRLQLSSNRLSRIPPQLGRLTHLQLAGNSLSHLTADDIKVLNNVKRISLGSNTSSFACDCETPSPLQLWLREKKNQEKVEDIESVSCFLPTFGKVPILSTLPSNDSICQEETVETKQYVDFVTNMERRRNGTQDEEENNYTGSRSSMEPGTTSYTILNSGRSSSIDWSSNTGWSRSSELVSHTPRGTSPGSEEGQTRMTSSSPGETSQGTSLTSQGTLPTSQGTSLSSQTVVLSTGWTLLGSDTVDTSPKESTEMPSFTTPRQRRKYSRDHNPDEFLNALIFILFVCVLILVITIAFTLYYRFIRVGEPKHHKHEQEEAPLNGTEA